MKRFTALFLTLAMLLSLCPTTVWAEEQVYADEQVYIVENETEASHEEAEDSSVEMTEDTSNEEVPATTEDIESPTGVVGGATKNSEAEYVSATVSVSAPLSYSVSDTAQAQWGLAGADGTVPVEWAASGTLADAMSYANSRASGEVAYIQLLKDVNTKAMGALVFDSGKTTILDLNGYDIDRGLTAATSKGYVIRVDGDLTLCDASANAATTPGTITGGYNSSGYGGGVYVYKDATFTMTGGRIRNNAATSAGGGVYVYEDATFTMSGGTISGNRVQNSSGTYRYGGGVYNSGTFTMTGGTISNNNAKNGNGYGGGVSNSGTFTINGGTISGNNADYGGGVYDSGTFTMTGGDITGNTASSYGGGVNGSFTMDGGTITGNTAARGGGVYVSSGTFTMTDGGITGNTASSYGGGVCVSGGTFKVSGTPNVTGNVKNGTLDSTTGLYELGEGGTVNNVYLCDGCGITVSSLSPGASIGVAKEGGTGSFTVGGAIYDDSGYFTSDHTDYAVTVDGIGNLMLVYPEGVAEARWGLATGTTKEGLPTSWASGTLYDATTVADLCDSGTLYIQLLSDVDTTVALTFNSGTTILDLNGYDIDRGLTAAVSSGYVIGVSGNLTLCDTSANAATDPGKITGGYSSGSGGGVYVESDGIFIMSGGSIIGNTAKYGGGVYVTYSEFTMDGGSITGNSASYGGGVYVYYSTFTMDGGNITSNTADDGGGVYVGFGGTFTMDGGNITSNTADDGGGVHVSERFTMTDGSITGNSASYGGGVSVGSDFTMEGGSITGNIASDDGGGVYVYDGDYSAIGDFTMSSGSISGNSASSGGGIYIDYGALDMSGGTVSGNSASYSGGVYVGIDGTFTMNGGTITGNNAKYYGGGVCAYGAFNLFGAPKISGNVKNGALNSTTGLYELGAVNNVYLPSGKAITVNTLSSDASVGVTMAAGTGSFSIGGEAYADGGYFTSDNTNYTVDVDGVGNLRLVSPDAPVEARWGLATGTNNEDLPTSWVSGTVSGAVTAANLCDSGTLYIQMISDAHTSSALSFNKTTILDLNGYDIDRGLTSATSSGYVIRVNGDLTLCDTSANAAAAPGKITGGYNNDSGSYGGGGVLVYDGTFTMDSGSISGNTAKYYGGGVYVYDGTFTMDGGSISGNTAKYSGGGVYVDGTFTMNGSTITGNTADGDGGGVYVYDGTFKLSGTPSISGNVKNGTLNSATGLYELGENGAVNNVYLRSGETITVNTLSSGANIGVTMGNGIGRFSSGGGSYAASSYFFSDNDDYEVFAVGNNLKLARFATVAFNGNGGSGMMPDQTVENGVDTTLNANTFIRTDYSFAGWNTAADGTGTAYADKTSIIAESAVTLYAQWTADHSHPTCGIVGCTTIEHAHTVVEAWTKLTSSDLRDGTLTLLAGKSYYLGEDITVDSSVNILSGEVNLCLNGKALALSSGKTGSVISISAGATLNLCDCSSPSTGKITGGNATYGGGVFNSGTFEMRGGSISGNTATYGGGVFGQVHLGGGTISNNTASLGGGVYHTSRTTTVESAYAPAIISNNTADSGGGVYINDGSFLMRGGEISGNIAVSGGGGIDVYDGTVSVSNTPIITGNKTGTSDSKTDSNIYLYNGKTITVGELTDGANIGITMQSGSGTFTDSVFDCADSNYFSSDDATCIVVADEENLKIAKILEVSFDSNGGRGTMSPQTVTSGIAATLNTNIFSRADYLFTGWNTAADGTGTEYADGASITVTSGMTLYAQWELAEAHWGLAIGESFDEVPSDWTNWGTLTEAIDYANGLTSGTAYIQLLTDVKTSVPLEFAGGKTTILDLNGKTIDRGLTEAVTNGNVITIGGNLTLCDTSESALGKITGGYASWGSGVYASVGATFVMNGGNITGNTATNAGGGIYVCDTFTMNGGTISNNTADEIGGGVLLVGKTFTMNGGTISNNTADIYGGGVFVICDTFTMNGGTISDNTAAERGGGVYVEDGIFNMNGGTITNNTAESYGGGVYVHGNSFTMTDGTISNNAVTSSSYDCGGGGVYIGDNGLFTMNSGTISGNTTYYNGAGVSCYGTFNLNGGAITENVSTRGTAGVHVYTQGIFNMTDGTISNNVGYGSAGVCLCTGVDDTAATFNMSGGSIIGNRSTWEGTYYSGVFLTSKAVMTVSGDATITNNVSTDGSPANVWVKGDPMRVSGALTGIIGITVDYEPTQDNPITIVTGSNHTLAASDAAVFVSDNGYLTVLDTTNNGVQLTLPEACWGEASGDDKTGKPTSWTGGTLADAMTYANGLYSGTAYIQLLSDVDTNAMGALVFNSGKTTILDLNGHDIDRGLTAATSGGYVIKTNGNLTLCDTSSTEVENQGTITGGYNSSYGGGVYVGDGTFTMSGGSICGNTAEYGGGVCGHVTMSGGSIAGNTAEESGGGVQGSVTMSGGSISNNTAAGSPYGYGGGVYGSVTMSGGSISNNTATGTAARGGGVYVGYNGIVTMDGGMIFGNAARYGGGVYLQNNGSAFAMNGGNLYGNTAENGGGVYVTTDATFTMSGGSISGNNAEYRGGGVYVHSSGNMTIAGIPVVSKNYENGILNSVTGLYELGENGRLSNVHLYNYNNDKTVTVIGALQEDAFVGVSLEKGLTNDTPVTIATGSGYTLTTSDAAKFVGDDGSFGALNSANNTVELKLAKANLSGADVVAPGSEVTLLLNVSGTGIAGMEGTLEYDSTLLEYVRCKSVAADWEMTQNDATYVMTSDGAPVTSETGVLAVTFRVKSSVSAGKQLKVTFKGAVLSNGTNEFNLGNVSWSGTVKKVSANASLTGDSIVSAGSEVTLTMALSGDSITRAEMLLNYDSSILEYVNYRALHNEWTVTKDGNKFTLTGEDRPISSAADLLAVTFLVKRNVPVGAMVSAAFTNIVTSDGVVSSDVGTAFWRASVNGTTEAQWGLATGDNSDQTPTTWVGSGTLVDATYYANELTEGVAYIQLIDDVVDTTAPLEFASGKTTVLDLNGNTIDRGLAKPTYDGNVITVKGNLTLCDTSTAATGKITGGYNDSGISILGGGVFVINNGSFTMNAGSILKNAGVAGGGVYVYNGVFIMNGGSISENTASKGGGGVYIYNGTFTMNDGSILGNTAGDSSGGGVYNDDTFIMNAGTISANTADRGGGVCSWGTFTMIGGKISGNAAEENGGGVWGNLAMRGGTISGNSANVGGGVYGNNLIKISGGTITGNTATGEYYDYGSYGYYNGGYGGGVYCSNLQVWGTPVITDNVSNGTFNPTTGCYESGSKSNVYLYGSSGNPITVVDKLKDGSCIGVAADLNYNEISRVVVTGIDTDPVYTLTESDAAKFFGDPGYVLEFDGSNNTVVMTRKPGGTVSGKVTSFLSTTNDVTVELFAMGSTVAKHSTTIQGNSATYSIANVEAGTYTMKVSKLNHVTREYTVTVGDTDVTQDAKIHPKGDVSGDGKVTINDVNKANLHYKKKATLSDYESLCADVSGDGRVTINDVNKLNLHYKKKAMLW